MPELIRDQYEVVSEIGAGGMGKVLLARDLKLNRMVALKTLLAVHRENSERRQRFFLEAQAASALNHPNIITIYDILSEPEREIMVMEYVQGKTLVELIPKGGMRPQQSVDIAAQVADALEAAHGAGIVHRDLKPGNIMVTDKGLVKILDFGLAKREDLMPSDDPDATALAPLTSEGTIMGTVAYMSPEQASGKRVDGRSDIFSFGAVMYEMATGLRAFTGDNNVTTLTSVLRDEPKPAGQMAPDLPPMLVAVIYRCLRKELSERAQTMADVKAELRKLKVMLDSGTLLSGAQIPASMQSGVYRPANLGGAQGSGSQPGVGTSVPPASGSSASGSAAAGFAAGAAGAAAGAAAGGSGGFSSAPPPPPPPTPQDAVKMIGDGWRKLPRKKRIWITVLGVLGLGALFSDKDRSRPPKERPSVTVRKEIEDAKSAVKEALDEAEALDNSDVIALVKGKMSEEMILDQLRTAKTDFDLSPKEVVKLVEAGVSERLIAAMRDPKKIPPPGGRKGDGFGPPPMPPGPPGSPKKGEKGPPPLAEMKDGMPIELELQADVPQDAMPGTELEFRVANDVMVEGQLAIPKGSPALGVVIVPPSRRMPGRGGRGMFLFAELMLPGRKKLKLRPAAAKVGNPFRSFDTGANGKKSKDLLAEKGTIYVAYATVEGGE